jgi:vacuolar-type H+-ATPase subunit I/STV1
MKIFNQGGRLFKFYQIDIEPGKFTTIPDDLVEKAQKLIADYPAELVTAEEANASVRHLQASSVEKDRRIVVLEGQVARLQKLLTESPEANAASDAVLARAEKAELRVKELQAQLEALEEQATAPAKKK